jgi:hypothetical protein
MAIPFFVEGRSAAGPAAIPLAMLAAIGLVDVVLAALQSWAEKPHVDEHGEVTENLSGHVTPVERNVFIYLLSYLLFSTYQFGFGLSNATVYSPDREAMQWVKENTPEDSRFLVLTGTDSVSCDSVMEWFPALTGRQSIYTVQGTEWTEGPNFNNYVVSIYPVQGCLTNADVACLDAATPRSEYDYLYISRILRVNNCLPMGEPDTFPFFEASIKADGGFEMVYESEGVLIYRPK